MATADVRMKGFKKRASVDEALALIEARVHPLGLERVPFRSALGRILAEDVVAPKNVPPHPRSAMDGYAVRSSDLPGTLTVSGEITVAQTPVSAVGPKTAVRIMTGAKIPDGADAVVMVEDTKLDGDRVTIEATAKPRQHILEIGADLRQGDVVLARGRKLRPQDISMLVSVGALEVALQRKPRVRIVPTGNELIRAGAEPKASEVIESNSFMLEGLAIRDGADPMIHPIVPDQIDLLTRAMSEPGADLVVVTGGSSVGKEDFPPVVLREKGELAIHGIDVRPASPTGIGFIGSMVVVLSPGYPVASMVAWDLFARAIVQRMTGLEAKLPYKTTRARLSREIKKPLQRVEIQRVTLSPGPDGGLPIPTVLPGGAAILSTVTRADGFLLLPAGADTFAPGTELDVHLYD